MEIRRYESDLLRSNMYVIVEGTHAIVIDPFRSTDAAEGLHIDRILLTHEHYDHISGVRLWQEKTEAPVLCSRACSERITSARKNLARLFDAFCDLQTWIKLDKKPDSDPAYTCKADEVFDGEMQLDWQGHRFRLFEMPGHSPGSMGILVDDSCFFSGDSVMEDSEIELRLPGGSREQWETVGRRRLEELPADVRVYPGHFHSFPYQTEGR